MKKIAITAISLLMIVALCVSFVGCSLKTTPSDTTALGTILSNETEFKTVESETVIKESSRHENINRGMKLMASGTTTYASNYSAQTLIATVTPESATNKNVIWSIEWESPDQLNLLESYFGVFPSYEGSNVAEVRCYAEPQFSNCNAVVKAMTEDGNYLATCLVIFRGKPTSMSITAEGITQDDNGNYLLSTDGWRKYEFDIDFRNAQGYVHPDYMVGSVEILSLTGRVIAANAVENPDGELYFYPNTDTTIDLSTYLDSFEISVTDSVLTLKYDFSTFSENAETGSSDETYHTNHFRSLIEDEECIMTIKVTNNTGVSDTITLKFTIPVTGVTLDNGVIYF